MNTHQNKHQDGFALLLTLVVISVVLAIGLSLLNITVKQFTLSSTIRDSEIAFFAANTGIECVQYAVNNNRTTFFSGGTVEVECGSYGTDDQSGSNVATDVHQYQYEFDSRSDECIQVSVYTLDATTAAKTYSFPNEGLQTGTCNIGGQCTYLFSRGYNRSCGQLSSLRVVQREIAVDF